MVMWSVDTLPQLFEVIALGHDDVDVDSLADADGISQHPAIVVWGEQFC